MVCPVLDSKPVTALGMPPSENETAHGMSAFDRAVGVGEGVQGRIQPGSGVAMPMISFKEVPCRRTKLLKMFFHSQTRLPQLINYGTLVSFFGGGGGKEGLDPLYFALGEGDDRISSALDRHWR